MYAFVNQRSSCFLDTVIVVMFSTPAFDSLVRWHLADQNPVINALSHEVGRLRRQEESQGWEITGFRELMGSPWNNGEPQSAVDFMHALFKACGVAGIGTLRRIHATIPRTYGPSHAYLSDIELYSVHLAIAGQHHCLVDVLAPKLALLPAEAAAYATITGIVLEDAPVVIFEVGRTTSTACISYGTDSDTSAQISIQLNEGIYILIGVVCRKHAHYVGFIWSDLSGWGIYDDLVAAGAIRAVKHPETHEIPPSRFGELFYFIRVDDRPV